MSQTGPSSFLLIRFSSLGDVVLQTAAISFLKVTYPDSKITFLTSSEFTTVLEGIDGLDKIISFDRTQNKTFGNFKKFVKKVEEENNFDYIVDLHNNTRTMILKFFLRKIPSFTVSKFNMMRRLLVLFKLNLLKNEKPTQVERNLLKLKNRLHVDTPINNYPLTKLKCSDVDSPSPLSSDYLILAPVASFEQKRWPIEYYRKLSEMILTQTELSIVCLGGPDDNYLESLDDLESMDPNRFHYMKGKLNLIDTQPYLKNAKVVIGNDSGLNHMSEALGTNVITIFGPTHEDFGFRPHLKDSISMSENLWCRPCSTKGNLSCFRKKQYCMLNIKPEDVYEKIKTFV